MNLNSAGISFSGLSSGLDTDSIISQLVRLETQSISRIQRQQAQLQTQRQAYGQLRSLIQSFNASISALSAPGAFDSSRVSSSHPDAISAIAVAGARPASSDVVVQRLATAQRIASVGQSAPDAALGLNGSFTVNGKSITVVATDTLQSLASKINGEKAGVAASVVNGGPGRAYLTLTSDKTGLENSIQVADANVSGPLSAREGILAKLGLIARGAETVNLPAVLSLGANSSTQTLADAFGAGGRQTFTIGGQTVTLDAEVDTLESARDKLAALRSVDARIVETVPGEFQLEVVGDTELPVALRDFLRGTETTVPRTFSALTRTELVAAQDAQYTVDGIAFTSGSNTLTNVVPGTTLTLRQADPARTINIRVDRDTEASLKSLSNFAEAYNRINGFIRQNSQFDSETFESGVLFGNSTVSGIQGTLATMLFNSVAELPAGFRNLANIGFGFDEQGNLTLNQSTARTALQNDPNAVAAVLRLAGSSTSSALSFTSGTQKTTAGTFEVSITQAATRGRLVSAAAQTGPLQGSEVLRFSGAAIGSTAYELTLDAGMTQAQIAQRINNDARLSGGLSATVEDGRLVLTSKSFGTAGDFFVSSTVAAGSTSSGVGTAGQSTYSAGTNVAGTINGEPANGSGQFLVGRPGNPRTEGLQIQYTGSATGNIGSISVTKGIASRMFDTMDGMLNGQSGLFAASDQSLEQQIGVMDERIAAIRVRGREREAELRQRFAAMESAIASAQAQMARLQSIRLAS